MGPGFQAPFVIRFGNMENISYLCNKKFMFTLYHIPDRKEWGCTKNLKARLKKSKYTLDDVYETLQVEDIDEAAYLERELNIMYGYGWNESQDYRRVTKMTTKESLSKGGKIGGKHKSPNGGKVSLESGHLAISIKLAYEARRIPILQYDKDGNFINEWKSIRYAGNVLEINQSSITKACKGKLKTAGGFVFKYKLII